MNNNEIFKLVINKNSVDDIVCLYDKAQSDIDKVDALSIASIPHFSRKANNFGYSYDYPGRSHTIRENIANLHLEDGEYYLTMQYQYFRSGWAAGGNWYGGSIAPCSVLDN